MNKKSIIDMMNFNAKRLFLLFILGLTYTVCSLAAGGYYTDPNNNLKYLIETDNHTATVYPNDYTGDIDIPANVIVDETSYTVIALANECFKSSKIGKVTIPNSVKKLGDNCFASSTLTSITIPNSVIELGVSCFKWCSSLTSITIPESIKVLPDSCFYIAKLDEGISLPNTLKKIGTACFYKCSLINIELPSSVTEIGDKLFAECNNLTSVILPENLNKISFQCFYECKKLKDIKLPKALEIIEPGSFVDCLSLEQITIPRTVKEMNCSIIVNSATNSYGIFTFCSKLKEITIPPLVTTIGYSMVRSCSSLESITIGSGVKSINLFALAGCKKLKTINCYAVEPPKPSSTDPFGDNDLVDCILNVPKGSIQKYKESDFWKKIGNIYSLDTPEPDTEVLTANITDATSNIQEGTYYAGNLTYTREGDYVKAGKYSTLCLPFDINLAETECFSEVFIPMNLALYNTNTKLLTMMLDNVDMTSVIMAGQPFIARLAEDRIEVKNCNATYISDNYAGQKIETSFNVYNTTGESGVLYKNDNLEVGLGGTYQKREGLDKNVYKTFMSTGQFAGSDKIAPFRAYVYKANAAAQAAVQSITWGVGDETTGIKYIVTPETTVKDNKVFTLDGKLVNQTGDTKNLKKGIYIINGRKIIIK